MAHNVCCGLCRVYNVTCIYYTIILYSSYVLLNEILTALNNKQMVGGIFCELHKGFDCINHTMLLEKMKFYGVSGTFYNVIVLLRWKISKSSLKSQQWY